MDGRGHGRGSDCGGCIASLIGSGIKYYYMPLMLWMFQSLFLASCCPLLKM